MDDPFKLTSHNEFPLCRTISRMTSYLVVSGHDYRSPRRANVHFIADELAKLGPTRFASIGFSPLSDIKGKDPRTSLVSQSNAPVVYNNIETYLYRTLLHPFNMRLGAKNPVERAMFELYRNSLPAIILNWIKESDVVVVESGMGVLFFETIKKINPSCRLIYIASDDLETIGTSSFLVECLQSSGHLVDGIRVPSRLLASKMPAGPEIVYVPHGIDRSLLDNVGKSPFGDGINAVSVGSMLFDADFFHIAEELFPDINFHVIGSGAKKRSLPERIHVYGEMKFSETIQYIAHANFGIAPYKRSNIPYYLCDTSMKLMQYEFLRVPSVCPDFVVGQNPTRFGYVPDDPISIKAAIDAALSSTENTNRAFLSWHDVTQRILFPREYPDTRITEFPC